MYRSIDRTKEECPRCGLFYCENNGTDRYCPNCLFYEAITQQESSFASPSSEDSCNEDEETQTLGELIDQVPCNQDHDLEFETEL